MRLRSAHTWRPEMSQACVGLSLGNKENTNRLSTHTAEKEPAGAVCSTDWSRKRSRDGRSPSPLARISKRRRFVSMVEAGSTVDETHPPANAYERSELKVYRFEALPSMITNVEVVVSVFSYLPALVSSELPRSLANVTGEFHRHHT